MIIIPMAGLSSRFTRAGFTRPKYELPVGPDTLFALCIRSFERYFRSERFVFVCRERVDAERFIAAECKKLGIADFLTVAIGGGTRGQAETVLLGLHGAECSGTESLLIFNIDTIRPHYEFPAEADLADGYLEVFRGTGENWSFVKPAAGFSRRVAQTSEKIRLSNLCCTGLYHFSQAGEFEQLCTEALRNAENYQRTWGELYVAPLYNAMILSGRHVVYHETPQSAVHFSGTPEEYGALLAARHIHA